MVQMADARCQRQRQSSAVDVQLIFHATTAEAAAAATAAATAAAGKQGKAAET